MFQNKYDLEDLQELLSKSLDIVILGHRTDERSTHFINSLSKFKGFCLHLKLSDDCDKFDSKLVNMESGDVREHENLILIRELPDLLNNLNIGAKNVLIDITGLNHILLFLLIKILLTDLTPRVLFAAYTEPIKYIREDKATHVYILSSGLLRGESIPGFSKRDKGLPKVLVPLLGFEGNRLVYLVEEILQATPNHIVPIVGFPTYSPGWKSITLMANARILNTYECYSDYHSCEASSPFKLIRELSGLSKLHEGKELLIAPLGTRPHALGAAIYVTLNSNCNLVYDFPKEKDSRSEGIKKSNVYDISSFIRGAM